MDGGVGWTGGWGLGGVEYECHGWKNFEKLISEGGRLLATKEYTKKKIQWKNYGRFWKWTLKHTSQSAQNSFLRKSNLKFCIHSS